MTTDTEPRPAIGRLRAVRKAASVALRIAYNLLILYLVILGAERAFEKHPAIDAAFDRAVPVALPFALGGVLLYYVIRSVQAFGQGVADARRRPPAERPGS